jgi:hypothetical protein
MSCKALSTCRACAGRTKRHSCGRRRRGYVLVLVIMLLFGLMGLAALAIDVGFARLAQSEMQTAVDSAALEGLRNGPATAAARQQASNIVTEMFSNGTDTGGETVQYGAGPVVDFSGGVGDPNLAAGQLMQNGNPPLYQPGDLQANIGNAPEGDMVAGAYGVNSAYDTALSADEDANYNRRDFTPSTGTAAAASTAFLVRMRRTNNPNGLDNEAGVSSAGPPLPFLFGRGSMMARSGTGNNDLSVSSGITVRATAIAGPQPAKSVGPAYSTTAGTVIAQLAPFALRSDIWASLAATGSAATISVNPLAAGSGAIPLDGQFRLTLTSIGQPVVATASDAALLGGPQPAAAYVPIYADYGSQAGTIIGFVFYTTWSYQSGTLTLMPAGTLVQIGSQNVSPTMVLRLPAALAQADVTSLFQAHTALFAEYPLYAPALVNRYLGPNTP